MAGKREGEGQEHGAPHEVDATGEDIDARLLGAGIENADFGIRHTAVEARLRVRLVLDLPVALVGTCTGGGPSSQERALLHRHGIKRHEEHRCTMLRHRACARHGGGGNHSRRPMATTSMEGRTCRELRGIRFVGMQAGC